MTRFVTIRERNEMRAMRREGRSYTFIHATFSHFSHGTIVRHCKDIGRFYGGDERKKLPLPKRLIALREQGLPLRAIGERFGVSVPAVSQALKRAEAAHG